MRALLISLLFLLAPLGVQAETPAPTCAGKDLLQALPESDRSTLLARAEAAPYAKGLFWQATKDAQTITLAGTFHLDDPRLDPFVDQLKPLILGAKTLMVEAGPEEERALVAAMQTDPTILFLSGETLPQLLPASEWAALSEAMKKRGVPPFMAAKFQPWYLSVLLSLPNCLNLTEASRQGLDAKIIKIAQDAAIPIKALEPFDHVFRIFAAMTLQDQIDMIRLSLAAESQSEDFFTTMSGLYFTGDTRVIWELFRMQQPASTLTTDRADQVSALTENLLVNDRNASWIAPLEAAAADGPVFAAFGALHLSGPNGVLQHLENNGWTISPLPMAP